MDINVTFRRTEPSEALRIYAEEKISKIKKFLDVPVEAHIVLSVEKFRHQADVTVIVNGTRVKAMEETGDMYSAIDQVMDKVEKQIKRHLSKIRERRPEGGKPEELEVEESGAGVEAETLIQVEKMIAKPMDTEEAVMQLNFSKQEFLVFRNARSLEINVLYKRKDGSLGLIEPAS